jgi:Ca2+:H+ antiporter
MELSASFRDRYDVDVASGRTSRLGSSYRAIERATGHRVLVKLLDEGPHLKEGRTGEELLATLKRATALEHPNLVRLRDCGREAEGFYYLVSDYVEGGSFKERIAQRGRMEVDDALAATQGILQGLVHLHANGFIDGDLKLENVVLSSGGTPMITDFALPPLHEALGQIPSNPANVAPELIQSKSQPTESSDVYAVGAILYELLTGAPTFPAADVMEALTAHLSIAPAAPSTRVEDVPPEVDRLVARALRKEPSRRYPSAQAMLDEVAECARKVRRPAAIPGGRWNYLLVLAPVAIASHVAHWSPVLTFVACCIAIVPLAAILSEATEHLSEQVGAALGGFLNATFGNATEILICVFGIAKGGELVATVKASLTGSILGNLLFILGTAMLLGGIRRERQVFNRTAAGVGNSLMILAITGLLIPSIIHALYAADPRLKDLDAIQTNRLSLFVSAVLLMTYFLSLLFSLKTHRHLSADIPEVESAPGESHRLMPRGKAMGLLAAATLGISILSEALVDSVIAAGQAMHLNPIFMGIVVIAMVGNAAEHATAVMVGIKDKMDLAFSIALGSSIQVALFLAPLLVVVSHVMGRPMDLVFSPMEVVAVVLAVGATLSVNMDGESTWIEGALLLAVYAILAGAFWFIPATPGAAGVPPAAAAAAPAAAAAAPARAPAPAATLAPAAAGH